MLPLKTRALAGNNYYTFDIKIKGYLEYLFYTIKILERWTHSGQSIINNDYYSTSYPSEIILSLSINNKTHEISTYASSALVINPAINIHDNSRQEIFYDIIVDPNDSNICTYRFYISGTQYGQCIVESIYGNDNASTIDDSRAEFSLSYGAFTRSEILQKPSLSTRYMIAEGDRTTRKVSFTLHENPDSSNLYDFSEFILNLRKDWRTQYDIIKIYAYQPYYESAEPGIFYGDYITTVGFNTKITPIHEYEGLIIEKRYVSTMNYNLYISIDWEHFPEGKSPNAFVTIVY